MITKQFFDPKESSIRVKICGITRKEDAQRAIDLGADALGFNFWEKSKRALSLDASHSWISSLPKETVRIAVVVDASPELLYALRESNLFDAIQFHGNESPKVCKEAGFTPWIRAQQAHEKTLLEELSKYDSPWLLLDAAYPPGVYGGEGKNVQLAVARNLIQKLPNRNILLAGGLTPQNVAHAIQTTRPFGVDVASGVESSPGIKDKEKMRMFIASAKNALPKN